MSYRVFGDCDSFYFAMSQRTRGQLLRALECVYASVALFALTQGPVTRVWIQSASLVSELPEPSISHVNFATFLVIQIPALALWARRVEVRWWRERQAQALTGLLAWLGLTVIWSTFARHSLVEYGALLLTTVFGLYLAVSFSTRQFWLIVSTAMAAGVGLSWVAVMRLWEGAVNFQENYWIGIYYNRNSLAPVTAVSILGCVGVVCTLISDNLPLNKTRNIVLVVATSLVLAFSGIELWRSGSQTSPAALVVAALLCLVWLFARTVARRVKRTERLQSVTVPLVLVLAAIAMFFVLRHEIGVNGVETETTAFNQRSGLWSLSWAGFLEKPWHGWGWMSAWHTPLFFLANKEAPWKAWNLEWSHSGYHDLLLGGGVPAAILFAMYLWTASQRISVELPRRAVPRLLLVGFVLSAATQESFFVGTHFMWALLVAALSFGPYTTKSADEKHTGQNSA